MIPKEQQDIIIKQITTAIKDNDLGVIIMRPDDGSLVIYINDPQSAINNIHRLNDKSRRELMKIIIITTILIIWFLCFTLAIVIVDSVRATKEINKHKQDIEQCIIFRNQCIPKEGNLKCLKN